MAEEKVEQVEEQVEEKEEMPSSFDLFGPSEEELKTIEETHVPIAKAIEMVNAAGKSTSALVRTIGGDRRKNDPLKPHWTPIYHSGQRWIQKVALEKHMDDIPNKPVKKEKEEDSKEEK